MTYRVIQWGVGKVGAEAVKCVADLPGFELVGAWVRADEKAGRDVGELCGIAPLGIITTQDVEKIIATPADAVVFSHGRDWARDPEPTLQIVLRLLRSGKSVVSSWWPSLVHSRMMPGDVHDRLQQACLDGNSSIYTTGMDPGYGSLGLALSVLNLARRVDVLHTYEFFNNGLWNSPDSAHFFGFGKMDESQTPLLAPGFTSGMHGTTVHLLAEAAGLKLDGLEESATVLRATETFTVPIAHVPAGTISGVRYQVKGMIDGRARVILDHVESIRDEDYGEFGFVGNGYRVEIEGDPFLRMDLTISDKPVTVPFVSTRAAFDACATATAANSVKAIPALCKAKPGVKTILDLPFHHAGA